MHIAHQKIPGFRIAVHALLSVILCMLYQPAVAQPLTAIDSAAFQRSLLESTSNSDRINYLLKLADYAIEKPTCSDADRAFAVRLINEAKKLNTTFRSKEAEGHILLEELTLKEQNGISLKDIGTAQKIVTLLQTSSDKCLLATAYKNLCFYYDIDAPGEIARKIELIKTAVGLYKQCGGKYQTADALQHLGEVYIAVMNFKAATETLNESLAIYNSIHYTRLQELYDLFGSLYRLQADYNSALKYQLLALKTAEEQKDTSSDRCIILIHMSSIMQMLDQTGRSIEYLRSALVMAKRTHDTKSIFVITQNLANSIGMNYPKEALHVLEETTRDYGEPQDGYLELTTDKTYIKTLVKLNRTAQAKIYVDKILKLIQNPRISKFDLRNIYGTLIEYYIATKSFDQASILLIKQQQLDEESRIPTNRVGNLRLWYMFDSARQNYKGAFFHLMQYKTLRDSIFTESKSRQIEQLQVQYETQKKENDIKLKNQDIKILTQNAKIDQVQLKGARISRNVTLAAIAIFILIIWMQYRRYHEKQKINTLITDKNAALQKLVNEKEWLLKEVHHRVKNNLHTVICLLESQAAYLEDDALKAIESSQHRIFAMSLIHQRLYQSTDVQTIDMATYLPEFILYLKESFGTPANVIFQQDIGSITLDVAQATPLALIVNESVTNAIKYAFPGNRPGIIKISLLSNGDLIRLSIEDNGIGIAGSIEPDKLSSLGMQLIRGLTDDLKGDIQLLTQNGTSVIVSFRKETFIGL